MLIKNRPDGNAIRVPGFTKLLPIVSGTRNQSSIYFEDEVYLDKTLDFIDEFNKNRQKGTRKLSVFQIFINAIARTVAERPKINRFIVNYRFYQRNHISVSFVSKKTLQEEAEEINIIVPLEINDTIVDVNNRFSKIVYSATSENGTEVRKGTESSKGVDFVSKLPIFILQLLIMIIKFLDNHNWVTPGILKMFPFYSTVFIANTGSFQLDRPYHHNFDMGACGIFLALGIIQEEKYISDDNTIKTRKKMRISYTFDDRVIDGMYSGKATKILRHYVENPEYLMENPGYSDEYEKKIGITPKGKKLFKFS